MFRKFIIIYIAVIGLAGCASFDIEPKPILKLIKTDFNSLENWDKDNHQEALIAFEKSCEKLTWKKDEKSLSPGDYPRNYGDLKKACNAYLLLDEPNDMIARKFFENWFEPYLITDDGNEKGLFTGYYESALNGSLTKSEKYKYPLHLKPDDLVMVYLGKFRDDLKGRRIAGRVRNGQLLPFEDRSEIVNGDMPNGESLEFVWIDNPIDPFFLQIQGSGRVNLDNGDMLRVGYAGQNGHPYYAIGRELVKLNQIPKEEISLQSIRKWLGENPDQADDVMNSNKSYVFFRELNTNAPIGAQNVELTAGRSLAVDRTQIPYGLPIWLDADSIEDNTDRIQRLLISQDTGGAIRGIVRGDVFWGYGKEAEHLAGHMKSEGKYYILLPVNNF